MVVESFDLDLKYTTGYGSLVALERSMLDFVLTCSKIH